MAFIQCFLNLSGPGHRKPLPTRFEATMACPVTPIGWKLVIPAFCLLLLGSGLFMVPVLVVGAPGREKPHGQGFPRAKNDRGGIVRQAVIMPPDSHLPHARFFPALGTHHARPTPTLAHEMNPFFLPSLRPLNSARLDNLCASLSAQQAPCQRFAPCCHVSLHGRRPSPNRGLRLRSARLAPALRLALLELDFGHALAQVPPGNSGGDLRLCKKGDIWRCGWRGLFKMSFKPVKCCMIHHLDGKPLT